MSRDLHIFYSVSSVQGKTVQGDTLTFEQLVRIAKSKRIFKQVFKYRSVTFHTPTFTAFPRPFLVALLCRGMCYGTAQWINKEGETRKINLWTLLQELTIFCREFLLYRFAVKRIGKEVEAIDAAKPVPHKVVPSKLPVYLRFDLTYGFIAGGSVGHIAGVLNNMDSFFNETPVFISSDIIPTVRDDIHTVLVTGKIPYRNVRDISNLFFNKMFYESARKALKGRPVSIVYQRSALNCYAGVKLAQELGVPLVLEYNGSEVWASKHWAGRNLKAGWLSNKIDLISFQKAGLIVCVSKPLMEELVAMGIPEYKILVNPNGVNEQIYRPDIDGSVIRQKYNIALSDIVIGFIGTFGAWHGAEVLAKAFAKIAGEKPNVKLMMIGDGERMQKVRKILRSETTQGRCVYTGMVPQQNGPDHLAACDILVSPQVRNPDGTPFFGSPTKLFEYMAMGKAIVASNLDQIGEVISHQETGLLFEPGDTEGLANCIISLVDDRNQRNNLGISARKAVLDHYTWKQHTKRIFDKLTQMYPG